MNLKKIETTTTLSALLSGHVVHKLAEFAPGGWKAPTPEQTELFQMRTDVFRPVALPTMRRFLKWFRVHSPRSVTSLSVSSSA